MSCRKQAENANAVINEFGCGTPKAAAVQSPLLEIHPKVRSIRVNVRIAAVRFHEPEIRTQFLQHVRQIPIVTFLEGDDDGVVEVWVRTDIASYLPDDIWQLAESPLLKALPEDMYQQARVEILIEASRQFLQKLLESVERSFSGAASNR